MSDGQQPLFFGGLPPRDGAATAPAVPERAPRRSFTLPARRDRDEQVQPLNTMSLVAFIGSFVVSVLGIVGGLVALRQLKSSNQRGRGLALSGLVIGLIGVALTLVVVFILMLGGPELVRTMATVNSTGSTSSETLASSAPKTVSAKEAAEAKAAIAAGGAAIPGHIVSADLCAAVKNFSAVSGGTAASTSPEQLAAIDRLAAVKSPNQATYERFAAMTRDPASVTSVATAQQIASDFAKGIEVDAATCL